MGTSHDRVRRFTAASVLARIDGETYDRLLECADGTRSIEDRLDQLQMEWDTDRVIETEAALMGLTGLLLGTFVDRRFYAISGVVVSMMLTHAATGFYPLLPLFRRAGVRSSKEISRERFALKAIRGDFDGLVEREAHPAEARR